MNLTRTLTAFWLVAACLLCSFQSMEKGTLTVEFTGLRSDEGHLLVSLYNKEEGFPKDPYSAIRKEKLSISNGKAKVVFRDLPYGRYAIAFLHDINDNTRMDFNLVGMPREGYGFSNNARGKLGPPKFDKAAFELKEPRKTVSLKTEYFLQ